MGRVYLEGVDTYGQTIGVYAAWGGGIEGDRVYAYTEESGGSDHKAPFQQPKVSI